jgi:hypothetical protein
MSDDPTPFYAPGHIIPKRQPNPGELLFEFVRPDHMRVRVELRDHGEIGCEVQIFHNEEFRFGYRHPTRALAVAWAEKERQSIEKGRA